MRYSGFLGIVEEKEVSAGVWEETVTEVPVIGDLLQVTETLMIGSDILPRVGTTTSIKVHARGLGQVDDSNIRYATRGGRRWSVTSAVTEYPRLTLYLGGEYNGPVPE